MGWFWNSPSTDKDAFSSLDPKLKAYLDKSTSEQQQQQQRQQQPSPSSQPSQQKSFSEKLGLSSASPSTPPPPPAPSPQPAPTSTTSTPSVPAQSLYQDGRYAHLWSTYTPPPTSPTPSSQDALQSLLSTYSARRSAISRAALENCVEEHLAENACFTSGTLAKKLGACRKESRRFARCYELQARMLRGMGWMDVEMVGLTEEEGARRREAMQMRADEVWTEICRREDETERARKEGRKEPEFGPLDVGRGGQWVKKGWKKEEERRRREEGEKRQEERERELLEVFTAEKRAELETRLAKLPAAERELELRLEIAEAEVHRGYGRKVGEYIEKEKEERRERREKGESTIGDWLKSMGGWSQ
ncbi:hypothetical protein K461DRAFT_52276 [Myriangium duriaei CBS 260.36]|uniref:Uncharacterized protein n=1 Tax=Myriangium duriaei CBS 260.36 TaxID=1168546 RepID=A0A9P4IXN1_9PEZI|nr:hypothetical protein K461DRAFT_52276 [Myriangium duriaei CBS 260.36]